MSSALISSTKAHLAPLFGSRDPNTDNRELRYEDGLGNTIKGRSEIELEIQPQLQFPDSRFLEVARYEDEVMGLIALFVYQFGDELGDADISLFGNEYGEEIVFELEREIKGLLDDGGVGDGASLIFSPNLSSIFFSTTSNNTGCRISYNIQTKTEVTRWPLRKVKETQVACLALEPLAPLPTLSTSCTPESREKDQIEFLGSEQEPEQEAKGKKVYTCWQWHTARVGGCSFFWGFDFNVDDAQLPTQMKRRQRTRPCFLRRFIQNVKFEVEAEVGRRRMRRSVGMGNWNGKGKRIEDGDGKGDGEKELKPLLF
ncbi:hypothetical protein EG329_013512 [Mollisiaceae sp. DMI_Dod_QoI]|nr:hypothetical protein EG329_013512 [Helotiales sp. DMI_Dod_QoI]